jgi:hypothetical protein
MTWSYTKGNCEIPLGEVGTPCPTDTLAINTGPVKFVATTFPALILPVTEIMATLAML